MGPSDRSILDDPTPTVQGVAVKLPSTITRTQENHMSENETTPYQMAVNNVARAIRDSEFEPGSCPDAFMSSAVLAMAFCKAKEEVIEDIIKATNIEFTTRRRMD